MKKRILNILIALDQLLFSLLTVGQYPSYHTISGFAYKWERSGSLIGKTFRFCIDLIFLSLRSDHCLESYLSEILFEKRLPYK